MHRRRRGLLGFRSSRPRTGIAVVGVLAHDFEAAILNELPKLI